MAACLLLLLAGGIAIPAPAAGEPDLSFGTAAPLLSDDSPMDGEPVYLNTTVAAEGIGTARSVMAEFLIDGRLEAFVYLDLAPDRGPVPVSFRWTARQGLHNLSIILDPLGEVNESDEGNNLAWVNVRVRAPPAPAPDAGGYYILAATVALIVAAGALFFFGGRSGPGTGGGSKGQAPGAGAPPTAR